MRPNEAELKLLFDDDLLGRFTIRQGETIAFGRQAMPDSAELSELARKGAFAKVGRVHAHLQMLGKRLAVRPTEARHRVWVRTWDSRGGASNGSASFPTPTTPRSGIATSS